MSENQVINFVPPGGAVGGVLLPQALLDLGKTVGGQSSGINRISIKGHRFRMMVSGQQVAQSEARHLDVVIVGGTGATSRKYYKGAYTGESTKPTCWSTNGIKPNDEVPAEGKQNGNCAGCHQNTKGSKTDGGKSYRACSFSQRVVVVPPDKLFDETATAADIYALDVNATSAFGSGDPARGKHSLNTYVPYLATPRNGFPRGIAIAQVVTRLEFDSESSTPRLFFSVAPNDQGNASFLNQEAILKLTELCHMPEFKRLIEVHAEDFVENDDSATTQVAAPAPAPAVSKPSTAPTPSAPKKEKFVPAEKTWRDVAQEGGIDEDDIQTIEDRGGPYSEKGRKFWDKVAPDGLVPPAEKSAAPEAAMTWQEVAATMNFDADDIETLIEKGGPYTEKGRKYWDKFSNGVAPPPISSDKAPPAPPAPPKLRAWKDVAIEAGAEEDDIETLTEKGGPGTESGRKYWDKVVKVSLDGVDLGGSSAAPAPAPAAAAPATDKAKGGRPKKADTVVPPVTAKAGQSLADKIVGFDD